jgi:hypothetical protein
MYSVYSKQYEATYICGLYMRHIYICGLYTLYMRQLLWPIYTIYMGNSCGLYTHIWLTHVAYLHYIYG